MESSRGGFQFFQGGILMPALHLLYNGKDTLWWTVAHDPDRSLMSQPMLGDGGTVGASPAAMRLYVMFCVVPQFQDLTDKIFQEGCKFGQSIAESEPLPKFPAFTAEVMRSFPEPVLRAYGYLSATSAMRQLAQALYEAGKEAGYKYRLVKDLTAESTL